MIVVDASAIIDILSSATTATRLIERVLRDDQVIHAPHLIDPEVLSGLRSLWHRREITTERVAQALEDLTDLAIERHDHMEFAQRVWELRNCLSVYDAMYVALAEKLDAPLITRDARMARSSGHNARIELIP